MKQEKNQIEEVSAEFIKRWFEFYPHNASEKGYFDFNKKAPIFSNDAIIDFKRGIAQLKQKINLVNYFDLDLDERIDFEYLQSMFKMATFPFDELQWHKNNPLLYVKAAIESIENMEFLIEKKGANSTENDQFWDDFLKRVKNLPKIFKEAKKIKKPIKEFAEVSIEMLQESLRHIKKYYLEYPIDGELIAPMEEVYSAMLDFLLFLKSSNMTPFIAMGPDLFQRILLDDHFLNSHFENYLDLAKVELGVLEKNWSKIMEVSKGEGGKRKREIKSQLAIPEKFDKKMFLELLSQEIVKVESFLIAKNIVDIPQGGKVLVKEVPAYLASLIPGASYFPPLAHNSDLVGHLFIPKIKNKFNEEQKKNYFERISKGRARNLIVHELFPGHHLQFLHSAAIGNNLRKFKDNEMMVEGWAFYCEDLMREQGLWHDMERPKVFRAYRFRLLRVIVDISIHTGKMSLNEAAQFLISKLGSDHRSWVSKEVRRYATEPTQAMGYWVGRKLIFDLKEKLQKKEGANFNLKNFHNSFLSFGTIPIPLIEKGMVERTQN